ncbi:MAG: DUF2851 family protein [Bacteroidales bacterium]
MNEAFISYLWKHRCFSQELITESGEPLAVLCPGDCNSDSGPDFFNARIRIGNTTWAGNVEIHVQASDWYRHGHQGDPVYDHAILHVVYEADRQVFHENGEPMQTLVVRHQFPGWIYERYLIMMQNKQWIPCMNQLSADVDYGFTLWAPALAVERLEGKSGNIRMLFTGCGSNWDEAIYQHLAGSFGFKINGLPFELLAKSLPVKVIRHYVESRFQLEALLFGQAGLLHNSFEDEFPGKLYNEYQFLRAKHHLTPISGSLWRFLRLRPSNFPPIRISQFACFLYSTRGRLFELMDERTLTGISGNLKIRASDYWDTHYMFDKPAPRLPKILGGACSNLLIINGFAPFLFFYGRQKDQPGVCEGALNLLENTPGENNLQIEYWKKLGFPVDNAMQTQALLHLKQSYCDKRQCLDCRIGNRLLADQG